MYITFSKFFMYETDTKKYTLAFYCARKIPGRIKWKVTSEKGRDALWWIYWKSNSAQWVTPFPLEWGGTYGLLLANRIWQMMRLGV
jgi:hypothetical protein